MIFWNEYHRSFDNNLLFDSALELGGERRRVTIMMTDLRGFTALSERLEPEQVVQMLNAYFEIMVDAYFQSHRQHAAKPAAC